jgi:tetratricopeptide (TPR) repeat protein
MSPVRWMLVLALGAGTVVGPRGPKAAHAQSASEIAAAKQWFSDALALEDKKQFAEALTLFKKAMDVKRTPQIVFHVALCELETNALVEALVDFERAIELAKAEGNDQVESAASAELSKLQPRVPRLRISVKGDAHPTRLTLDNAEIALSTLDASMPVNPGRHTVVAEFETGRAEQAFQVAEKGNAAVELVPPAGPSPTTGPATAPAPSTPVAPESAPPTPAAPSAPEADKGSANVVPWVVLGGGVLVTAGGFYMWKLRGDRKDELDAMCPEPDRCPPGSSSEIDDLQSKGKTYTTLSIAMWGVGAAALATGGYLLLSSGGKSERGARVAPLLAPGFAGGSIAGRF